MQDQTQEIKPEDIPETHLYFHPDFYSEIEIEIIQCMSWGMTNQEIGAELDKTEGAIKGYRHRIKTRLEAPNMMRVVCDYIRYDEKMLREKLANSMVGL